MSGVVEHVAAPHDGDLRLGAARASLCPASYGCVGDDFMPVEVTTLRKVTWRIVPFVMLLYFTSFIDRVNIGFAALTMNKDIGLSPAVFGLGAGIFFLGYFLFEVPSNLILHRIGARIWIARVMITWGIASGAMAFAQGPVSFYVLRFL